MFGWRDLNFSHHTTFSIYSFRTNTFRQASSSFTTPIKASLENEHSVDSQMHSVLKPLFSDEYLLKSHLNSLLAHF